MRLAEKGKWIMNLNEIGILAAKNSQEKGFHCGTEPSPTEQRVALLLIHTEVSEAVECLRDVRRIDFLQDELADIIIRTCELASRMRIDLDGAVSEKMELNKKRPFRHGKIF